MPDGPVPELPEEAGERLDLAGYRKDFWERYSAIRDGESWKLERLQHFEEVDDPSRDALRAGDWAAVLRLFEAERQTLLDESRDEQQRAAPFYRLRVVEEPLTPYMQWELNWLRLCAECGQQVRVLPAASVATAEADRLLPELTLLDNRTLYRVVYTEKAELDGGVRFTDPDVVGPWVTYLRSAYAAAEDIRSYFERAVAHLPPPPAG